MPELPEVEVVRRGIDTYALNKTLTVVHVLTDRSVRRHLLGKRDFESRLTGQVFRQTHRRGKFLWLETITGDALIVHLGMSGQMLITPSESEYHPHTRIVFSLDDGQDLRFVDQRIFGHLFISPEGGASPPEISHIAPDPLDPSFDLDALAAQLARKSSAIKRVLLDQRVVSGIGNIYADEALWRAHIHYDQPANRLKRHQLEQLFDAVKEVMLQALDAGGTSFDSLYVNVNGASGYFDRSLNAYGQEDEPCQRCGTPIVRHAFMNRSSYFCPRCQKPNRLRTSKTAQKKKFNPSVRTK